MNNPSVDRRTFLGMAGAGAGAMLAAPEAMARAPQASTLEDTLRLEAELLAGDVAPDVPTACGWHPNKLFNEAAATMMWSAKVHKSTSAERESAEMQDAIDARIDGMMAAIWATGLELDALDDAALADLEGTILDDPDVLEEARLKFTVRAMHNGVDSEEVERIDKLFDKTMWRIRRRGLASIRDEMVEKLDRVARRHDIDWRAKALAAADKDFVQPIAALDRAEYERMPPDVAAARLEDKARRQSTSGGVALGIGILWMAGPQIIFGGICFGPPLIIAGIVMLVAAGKKRRLAEEFRMQAAAEAGQ